MSSSSSEMFSRLHAAHSCDTVVHVSSIMQNLGVVMAPASFPSRRPRGKLREPLQAADMREAIDVLRAEEHPSQLSRTLAYNIVRYCSPSDLRSWREVSSAMLRDFSAADHPDHIVLALHQLESLPDDVLLGMAEDAKTDALMVGMIHHMSPAVRSTAALCVSGAWLRVWELLVDGQLRSKTSPRNDDGSVMKEGNLRQLMCDRAVTIWKKVLALCTQDEDDNVVSAAFEAMHNLFASCWIRVRPKLSSSYPSRSQFVSLATNGLLLRVFKSMSGQIYSLIARLRSLPASGTSLSRALPGLTSFFRYAMAKGVTIRLDGTSCDLSPVGLARNFADTLLLPMINGGFSCETVVSAALSIYELCSAVDAAYPLHERDADRWGSAIVSAIIPLVSDNGTCSPGATAAFFSGAEDVIADLLFHCMKFVPVDPFIECAVAIVRIISTMGSNDAIGKCESDVCGITSFHESRDNKGDYFSTHLLRGVARKIIDRSLKLNESTTSQNIENVLASFFQNSEWMRSLWNGQIWLPTFRERIATVFLDEAKKMAPLFINAESGNLIDPQASRWRNMVEALLHICSPVLTWPDLLPHRPTKAATLYVNLCSMMCKTFGSQSDSRVQQILDEIFEWHLPNIASTQVRLQVIRMLCAFWRCDTCDLGDSETLVAYMRDLLFGRALSLAVAYKVDFLEMPLPEKHDIFREAGLKDGNNSSYMGRAHTSFFRDGDSGYKGADVLEDVDITHRVAAYSVVELANILLPAATHFAVKNPVAYEPVNSLLSHCCGSQNEDFSNKRNMRNPVLVSLATRMKRWLAKHESLCRSKTTSYAFSELLTEHSDHRVEFDQVWERSQRVMSRNSPFKVLNGLIDPVACKLRHFVSGTKCRVDIRIYNLTRSEISNLKCILALSGPVAPLDGTSPCQKIFLGELLPGDMVEWSTSLSILGFGKISFHPQITVMVSVKQKFKSADTADDLEWEVPANLVSKTNAKSDSIIKTSKKENDESYQTARKQQPIVIRCSLYSLSIGDILWPTQVSSLEFSHFWSRSKFSNIIHGLWVRSRDIMTPTDITTGTTAAGFFEDMFSQHFASIHSTQNSLIGGILSAGFFASTVTGESLSLGITAYEIDSTQAGFCQWSVKFEFRSDKRHVVDGLNNFPEVAEWFRFLRPSHETVSNERPMVESAETAKLALSRWKSLRKSR